MPALYTRCGRDFDGFFTNRIEEKFFLDLARAFVARVVDRMLVDGNTEVQDILNGMLPGDEAMPYFAAELGGTIGVLSDMNYNPATGEVVPQYYGEGPLVLELHHYLVGERPTGHYTILQAYGNQYPHMESLLQSAHRNDLGDGSNDGGHLDGDGTAGLSGDEADDDDLLHALADGFPEDVDGEGTEVCTSDCGDLVLTTSFLEGLTGAGVVPVQPGQSRNRYLDEVAKVLKGLSRHKLTTFLRGQMPKGISWPARRLLHQHFEQSREARICDVDDMVQYCGLKLYLTAFTG